MHGHRLANCGLNQVLGRPYHLTAGLRCPGSRGRREDDLRVEPDWSARRDGQADDELIVSSGNGRVVPHPRSAALLLELPTGLPVANDLGTTFEICCRRTPNETPKARTFAPLILM